MKVETCNFSGFKIYPGHGSLFVGRDSKVLRFVSSKTKSLYLQRKKQAKFDWTIVFRKLHKKGEHTTSQKKRTVKRKVIIKPIVGADLDSIKKKREMTNQQRVQQRKTLIEKIKAQKKEKVSKLQQKGFAPKPAAKSR